MIVKLDDVNLQKNLWIVQFASYAFANLEPKKDHVQSVHYNLRTIECGKNPQGTIFYSQMHSKAHQIENGPFWTFTTFDCPQIVMNTLHMVFFKLQIGQAHQANWTIQ